MSVGNAVRPWPLGPLRSIATDRIPAKSSETVAVNVRVCGPDLVSTEAGLNENDKREGGEMSEVCEYADPERIARTT